MHVRLLFLLVFGIMYTKQSCAQISPPDLGTTNTAAWTAFGIRQFLDSANKRESFSYIGFGRISSPATTNPFFEHSIFVLNQEFYHRFHKHWRYSVAGSYRNKNEYLTTAPYEAASPPTMQEFRVYGRLFIN